MVTGGKGGGSFRLTCTRGYFYQKKQITNKGLLYTTGTSAPHSVILLVKPSDMFSSVGTAKAGKINIMWKTPIESFVRE